MFQLVPDQHDVYTAWQMSLLSELAYAPEQEIVATIPLFPRRDTPAENTHVRYFECSGDTQCFLAWCDKFAVVSFRGTEARKAKDIATDAKLRQKGGPFNLRHSAVHRGFWDSIERLVAETDIMACLHDATQNRQKVFVTGHSLGGALATLFAARLVHGAWPSPTVYTFGSPRVGNHGFAAVYDMTVPLTFRYVHQNDIVTRVPWILGRYRHVGDLMFIDGDYGTHKNPNVLHYFWMRYGGLKRGIFSWASDAIRDHAISCYIAAASVSYFGRKKWQ